MKRTVFWFAAVMAFFSLAQAQTNSPVRLVGTVSAIKAEAAELDIKPANGNPLVATWTADSVVQRVAPGEKDLRNAQPMTTTEISIGDRVLVVLNPGTNEIRRIVVMPALDIAKRDEASRQDWTTRGISGIMATTNGNQITLKLRGFQGETQATVVLTDHTTYRRYSVADAEHQHSDRRRLPVWRCRRADIVRDNGL